MHNLRPKVKVSEGNNYGGIKSRGREKKGKRKISSKSIKAISNNCFEAIV